MGKKYYVKRFKNFRQIINHSAEKFGDKTAFQLRGSQTGIYEEISYSRLRVKYYALCQLMIDEGLEGKAIAISGKNSFNWTLAYLSAATVGIAVPLDKEMSPEDKVFFIKEAKCKAVFADDKILNSLDLPAMTTTVSLDKALDIDENFWQETIKRINKIKISKKKAQVIIFTSGTTGSAKGVCLSQHNICSNIHSTVSTVKITPKDKTLSLLPLHHTYECTLDCLLLLSRGACITYCEGLANLKKNMQEYSPTILVVVPAVLNIMARQISKSVKEKLSNKYSTYFANNDFDVAMAKLPWIIRSVLKSKVRKELGGKLRLFIVGAAATDPEIIRMFNSLGIKTLQGYGLTECSPLLAGNSDFYINPESTGKAVPGVQIRIQNPNDEGVGEIVAKGENIMLGYFDDKKATKETFDDGWFKTGDLGMIDEDGFLYIKGRLKNMILSSNGKNIYPEELEKRLMDMNQVKECIILGVSENGDSIVKAKVAPDMDYLKKVLDRDPTDEEVQRFMSEAIESVNDAMAPYKRIKRFEVVDELEKTTTQKIKRYGKNLE